MDAEKAAFMADSQVPWGVDALSGTISEPAWKTKPSWYLVATDDKMIPPPAQRFMSKRAGSTVVEVAGSHAIYVSQPKCGGRAHRKGRRASEDGGELSLANEGKATEAARVPHGRRAMILITGATGTVGREVVLPPEAKQAALVDLGFPPWQADGLLEEFAMYRRGAAAGSNSACAKPWAERPVPSTSSRGTPNTKGAAPCRPLSGLF